MSAELDRARLVALLEGDADLLEALCEAGVIARRATYSVEEAELARVARTLVRELDVNYAGVEIILRMRDELVATQRQVEALLVLLRRLSDEARR